MEKSIGMKMTGEYLSLWIEITNRPDLPNSSWKFNHPIASKKSMLSTPSQHRALRKVESAKGEWK
ncbi:hypothetical protein CJO92_17145 (plasmid) [Ralstonia solanacearum]|uniref:Uncharacterized protein n=1 Tax=Ralstonia solanacearum TaxID=305 RepID=A0AAD0WHN7_RALSL|nr:hypothetical protein CJO77_17140 [Ralstonia solanacearum]AXW54478.1 hypothetical protein CJO92_17145 [Ralstonia solanacearum]